MATLENIRKRGALIAIVIGFALFAFILGDFIKQGKSIFGGSQNEVANINGNTIDIVDYQNLANAHTAFYQYATGIQNLDEQTQKGIKNDIWDILLKENLLNDAYDDCGIDVTDKEVSGLIFGENGKYDPLVQQLPVFQNPQTRQFDPKVVSNFYTNYMNNDPKSKQFGLYLEKLIRDNRKYTKYFTLIAKGMNITTAEAISLYKDRTNVVDFDFVALNYKTIADSTIKVSDSEAKSYYNKHKDDFDQKEQRDISYIAFEVKPSKADIQATKVEIEELQKEMQAISKDSLEMIENYVTANSANPFTYKHYKKGEYRNLDLDTTMFAAEVGATYGPYIENGFYKVARLIEKTNLPDSVEARNILIAIDGQKYKDIEQVKKTTDSLMTVLKDGGDFAEIAKKYSMSQNGKDGGKLDKFTEAMGYPKDIQEACFYGNTNDIVTIEQEQGIQIIEIMWQSKKLPKIQLAIIDKELRPSSATRTIKYAEASKFASENTTAKKFYETAEKQNLQKRKVGRLTPKTEVISGLKSPQQIIRWAFKSETEKGSISEIYNIENKFVIVIVDEVREEGIAPFEQVKKEIITKVAKEKKGEIFAKKLKEASSSDLAQVATKVSGRNFEAKNISFSSISVPNAGREPKLIATAMFIGKDKISEPIIGENGVYLLKVKSETKNDKADAKLAEGDKKTALNRLMSRVRGGRNNPVFEAIKNVSDIEDNRYIRF